jgi:hypothetical protein
MSMIRPRNLLISLAVALVVAPMAAMAATADNPAPGQTTAPAPVAAPAPKLSVDQLKKLIEYAATHGKVVVADKGVTDTLGLTHGKQEIYSPSLTVRERTGDLLHQMQPLPEGKGILFGNIGPTTVEVFLADKNLVLISAMTSVAGGPTAGMTGGRLNYPTPVNEAQPAYADELAYWAMVADSL